LESEKRFADAAKVYRQLINKSPSDAEAYAKLANTLLALGKTSEASSALSTAARLQGDVPLHEARVH
jgi:cytochrome c-type biogenesis protein CcmH/NrfG